MPLVLLLALLAAPAMAQSPLLGALGQDSTDAAEPSGEEDPLLEIERQLEEARQRRERLEQPPAEGEAVGAATSAAAIQTTERLIRLLEQRRDARIRSNDLEAGREAIEAGLARDPSELFGEPPPFPVPILDGVLLAWGRAVELEQRQASVLEDRRGNLALAREAEADLQKERRRLRDGLKGEDDPVQRASQEAALRRVVDDLAIAAQQLALTQQRVENAQTEHQIKQIATRQARAARSWVEANLAPRESDLVDAIERIDRERLELGREIELARARVASAEGSLRSVEQRSGRLDSGDERAQARLSAELSTRKRQLAHRQHRVLLLSQRIERFERLRTAWQQRYAVLGNRIELAEIPDWLESTEQTLEQLTRNRRIEEAELASLQRDLAELLRVLGDEDAGSPATRRIRGLELDDLETLIKAYERDLAMLGDAIQLEQRLRAELQSRLAERDIGERVRGVAESVKGFWSFEITASEDSPITPGKILIALFIFAAGYGLARGLMGPLSRRLFPRMGFDAGASNALASLTFYALIASAFLIALRVVNIPLTAFAVVGGALALGIGFGSQAIVSNFISGLLLLAERPIRMGDLIEVGGVIGTVESIGLRSTRIRTADNFHIIVPNASFLESNVVNWTHEDPLIRMRIGVGVAYGSDTRAVERLLLQAAEEHSRVRASPAPLAYFLDFADSALAFELRFWILYDERTDRPRIQSEIRYRIDELFREHGIVIAFPQIDVHLDRDEPDAETTAPESAPGSDPARPA